MRHENRTVTGRLARTLATWTVTAGLLAGSNMVSAQIPCSYDVQIIASSNGCGGFGTVNTFGLGLNERGDVVGYYRCPLWNHAEAFLWTAEGGFVTLQRPQGVSSVNALDINDDGVICGTLMMSGLGSRGFVYEKGEWTILEPVVPDSGGWSSAAAINNAGTVVGQRSITEDLGPQNAYIWSAEEGFTDLGVMNGPNSGATAVSEKWPGSGLDRNRHPKRNVFVATRGDHDSRVCAGRNNQYSFRDNRRVGHRWMGSHSKGWISIRFCAGVSLGEPRVPDAGNIT